MGEDGPEHDEPPPEAEPSLLTVRQTTLEGGSVVLALLGDLDLATAPVLVEAVARASGAGVREIELDCTNLSFLDSSGIVAMVEAWQAAKDGAGPSIVVSNPNELVTRVLRVTGVWDLLIRP